MPDSDSSPTELLGAVLVSARKFASIEREGLNTYTKVIAGLVVQRLLSETEISRSHLLSGQEP